MQKNYYLKVDLLFEAKFAIRHKYEYITPTSWQINKVVVQSSWNCRLGIQNTAWKNEISRIDNWSAPNERTDE